MALLKQLSSAFTGTAVIFCGLIVHIHLFKVNTDMKYLLSIYADRKKKVHFKCSCGTLKPTVTGTAVSFCGLIVHIHIIKVNTDMKYLLSIYADRKKRFTSNVLVALLHQLSSAFTGTAVSFCGLIVHIHIFKVNTDMKYLLSTYAHGGGGGGGGRLP